MNWLREIIDTRRQKKHQQRVQKQQEQLLSMFASFEKSERARLIFLDMVNKRVLLSDILTAPFATNDKAWQQFFQNLAYWFQFRMNHEFWNQRRLYIENQAIREEKKKHPNLSSEEKRIIRAKARFSMEYDESKAPQLDGYEFCICEGILRSDVKAEAVGIWQNGEILLQLTDV